MSGGDNINNGFKKVVDLEASRTERDAVRVKLRNESKQLIMSRRRQQAADAQPNKYNVTVPPGQEEAAANQDRVMSEIAGACKIFQDMLKLVQLTDGPFDPEKDPYAVILHSASQINVLLTSHAKVSEGVYEWALDALVESNILPELVTCLSDPRLVRETDFYALPMEAAEVLLAITSVMQVPKVCDVVLTQTRLVPLLIDWCTKNAYLNMRYQAIDCLGNMLTGSVLSRDTVLQAGFLPMISAQFDLPEDRSSNELWEACSYALAMVFHIAPLPELEVIRVCIPALFRLMFADDIPAAATAGLAGLAFITKKNDKNYTALIANCPNFTDRELHKLISFMVPKDYRNQDDLKNRAYSMATVVGLVRDVPGSWAPLWEAGALSKFATLLAQYDQTSIIRALLTLEFACADGAVQKSFEAGIYDVVCTGVLQEMMAHRQVKVGIAALLCTLVVTQNNPLTLYQAYKLVSEQKLFDHLVEGLKIGKLDVSLAQRCLEALDRLLVAGQTNMSNGVDQFKPWAEKTELVQILKEVETESENDTISNMASAMLDRHFDITTEKELDEQGNRKIPIDSFPVSHPFDTNGMTQKTLFTELAQFYREQTAGVAGVATATPAGVDSDMKD